MKPKFHIYEKTLKLDVSFPYTIDTNNIESLIKLSDNAKRHSLYFIKISIFFSCLTYNCAYII